MTANKMEQALLLQRLLYEETDDQHTVTVADILAYWKQHGIEAGRKSVYSAVDALQNCGVDVICENRTQNHYYIGDRLFELPELKLLVDAVESSRLITDKKSERLIGKLSKLTSTAQAKGLHRHVYMTGMLKPKNEAVYYNVDMLHTAIQLKRQVSFQYFEYTAQKKRVLKHDGYRYRFSPYALIWDRDFYYAVGWSAKHGKVAQFRVDRMTATELLEDAAHVARGFDPAVYAEKVFGMYPTQCDTLELLCENSVMRYVIDRFGEDVWTTAVDNQHFAARVNVAPSPPFLGWVFAFGGKIRITGPAYVLEEMKKMSQWLK